MKKLSDKLEYLNANQSEEITEKVSEIQKQTKLCINMESEIELKNTYLKNSENVIHQLRYQLSLSRKELQISKDDLEVITTECDELKKQVKKLIVSETDLVQKHAQNMTKVDNTIQTIELLMKENGILREENNSIKQNNGLEIEEKGKELQAQKHIHELLERALETLNGYYIKLDDADKNIEKLRMENETLTDK